MTAQVASLQLSAALAIELHGLFRALDLRIQTPEVVRDKIEAAVRALDELLDTEWSLPEGIAEILDRLSELLRSWVPEDVETWADLKAQLRETYAHYASALRQERVKVPELRPTNYTRSAFHVASAAVCMGMVLLLDSVQLMWAAAGFAAWAWSLETLRRVSPWANTKLMAFFRPIAHEQERHRVNSATWYMTSLVLLTLTFSPILCVVGVAVLGLGDPVAGLVGRRFGRIKLVNNRSLEGSLTFVMGGTVAAVGALQLVPHSLSAGTTWIVALCAATAGALAELFSRRIDDNIAIPVAAASTAALVLAMMGLSAWG